jgi:uncharacterized Rmd1/YagE family protein
VAAETVTARAYAFADTFKLKELALCFAGAEIRLEKDELYAVFSDGTAVAFDFGAVVFFGCDKVREQVVHAIARKLPDEPHPPLTEELPIEVDAQATPAYEARFDKVIVRELSPNVVTIVGVLLAQSAAMDYYDEDVEEVIGRTERITRDLQTRGRLRGRVRELIQFIGSCIHTRNGVIETMALFDKPDVTWEEEALNKLFVRLREVLEIDDRFRALEYKLRMIQDNLVLLVDLSRQRHTFWLEALVALLILFELGVMVWQVLHETGHG